MKVIIDTREKLPLSFRRSKNVEGVISEKLDVGDYSIKGYEDKISFDRKSGADLFGTLGKGHKRFKKEIERALDYDYFAIIIEEPYKVILTKDFENSHYSSMRGDVVVKILHTLKLKYGIDVIFCNGRREASSIIRNTFISYLKLKDGKCKIDNVVRPKG